MWEAAMAIKALSSPIIKFIPKKDSKEFVTIESDFGGYGTARVKLRRETLNKLLELPEEELGWIFRFYFLEPAFNELTKTKKRGIQKKRANFVDKLRKIAPQFYEWLKQELRKPYVNMLPELRNYIEEMKKIGWLQEDKKIVSYTKDIASYIIEKRYKKEFKSNSVMLPMNDVDKFFQTNLYKTK